jgi:hypothetical protein
MYLAQHLKGNTSEGEATLPTDATRLSQEAWYTAEQCEYEGHSKDCKPKDWIPPPLLKDKQGAPITGGELEPIFMEYVKLERIHLAFALVRIPPHASWMSQKLWFTH